MNRSLLHIRIPTYMGLLLLIVTVFVTSLIINTNPSLRTRANPSSTPENILISNITENSFTVSYTTAEKTTGAVKYGETTSLENTVLDQRDTSPSVRFTHFFTISQLKPSTKYYFEILSGEKTFNNNGDLYSLTTAAVQEPPESRKIKGSVLLPDGSYPNEGLAYLQSDNTSPLTTLLQPDGSFQFDLSSLRKSDLTGYATISDNDQLRITIFGDGLTSNLITYVNNSQTLPTITLSKQYDFRSDVTNTPEQPQELESLLPKVANSKPLTKTPALLVPKKDQQFKDYQPEFSGTALPSKNVELTIQSTKQLRVTVRSDKNGLWSYRPKLPLDPGNYTILMSTKDEAGITHSLSASFVIFAGGSNFIEPSPSIAPSPTVELPSPTIPPTTAPTEPFPTFIPTDIPIPTGVTTIPLPTTPLISSTPIPPISVAPGADSVVFTAGIAVFAVIAGMLLFFMTHV